MFTGAKKVNIPSARNERAASDVELHYTSVLNVEVTGASVSGDQTGQDQGKPRRIRKHNRTQKRFKREATRRCETMLKL